MFPLDLRPWIADPAFSPVHADLHHNDPSEEDLDEMG